MKAHIKWGRLLLAALALALPAGCDLAAPGPQTAPTPAVSTACAPTREDGLGPFYVPGAPERSSVGNGHVLSGVVRSSKDCSPIANATIEFWQVGPDGQYDDAHRATMYSEASGAYSFESNNPPGYSGRPPHIHLRVTALGHRLLVTQYYPNPGDTQGTFDLVLIPE
jgi:protocatechuate 3,4-dioxygenase beta subunit